ncbi:uncharacterized protein LOC125069512 [Vanessa atalanta]|uniref:uncharacterized protein LOC125069512 n=1 Tax=Vanessa atalanta TaxID=42275 RepID=UPI001FCD3E65|nr:uncharacterized protein LOC125069512 [Vanessa atalanta]
MTSLQDQANIPVEDRFKIAKGYEETNNEAIILENLCKRGYQRFDKNESISLKFVELGVQELAKLHGISFVIEKKMPKYFKENIAALDTSFHFDDDWNELMRKVFEYVANLFDDETKKKIERLVPIWLEKVPKYHNDKTTKCALCHGDYKKNNVMFRVINGEPVELIIIDYQLIEYGSPIKDLILFLYFGSDREFRREHIDKLKELYFETLSRFLQYFNIDVENILPRQKFDKTYREWLDYGLVMCLYFSVFLIPANSSINLKDMNLKDCPFNPDKTVEKMIRELVEDFIEWGYLDA